MTPEAQRLIVTVGQACGIARAWADNHSIEGDDGEQFARRWYRRTQGPNSKTWDSLINYLDANLIRFPASGTSRTENAA